MDWSELRTLSTRLRELFDEMEGGDHRLGPGGTVREDWRIRFVSNADSLANVLEVTRYLEPFREQARTFAWETDGEAKKNPFVLTTRLLLSEAERMLDVRDAAAEALERVSTPREVVMADLP